MEELKGTVHVLVDLKDGGNIATSVTVVWSRPNCNQVGVLEPVLETIHDKLMSSGHKFKVVDLVEFRSDSVSEKVACASWRDSPSLDVLWIGPHQVREWTLVWNLHSPVDESDLIQGLDLWGETSMDAENFALDDSTNSKVVEDLSAVLPWVGVTILAHGLLIETIDRGDATGLVVSSEEGDAVWILELEAEEELEGLH